MTLALFIKALFGTICILYGSLLLHDVAHEMDQPHKIMFLQRLYS